MTRLGATNSDPVFPMAAAFPLDKNYDHCDDARGYTITYINPTTGRIDDQTDYHEE